MHSLTDLPSGLYRGRVEGAESGPCEARIAVARVPGGCLAIDYEAVGQDGLQHAEHTLVAHDALYVAHSEALGVHVFRGAGDGVFNGPSGGPYDQRIVLGWDGVVLSWAWHWAPPGETLREQSRATARLSNG